MTTSVTIRTKSRGEPAKSISSQAIGIKNVLPTLNFDLGLEIVRGNINGMSYIHKFGRNPDIDMASNFEAIWNGGGDYTGFDATGAEVVELFSSDDEDGGAGTDTGALTIELYGLDSNYKEQTETLILNGTTKVDTTNTYLRLHRMIVRTAGSTGANIGTITARQKVTTANIFAVLPIGYNQTMIACYTIPAGKTGFLTSWFGALSKKQSSFSQCRLIIRPLNEVFQVKEEFTMTSTGSSYVLREFPFVKDDLPEKSDIKIMADASADNSGVSAGFDIILIDN